MPLIEANLIDFVLLVTLLPMAPSAITYVRETRFLRHLTYIELLNSIINFQSYVQGLLADFLQGELAKQYVPQAAEDKEIAGTVEEWLLKWIDSEDDRPVAVLGGYGIGKSTLARRLAYLVAERHLREPTSRIPILIPLSDIATDQTLEGLLGRHFTCLSVVGNYNYRLFFALNQRRRFLFILDGFDEMRKTMPWEAVSFNLQQLHQLVVRGAKVVLLGRPTAFLSDREHNEALHGRRFVLDVERRIPDWPDYREVWLRPFNTQQIIEFINSALTTSGGMRDNATRKLRAFIDRLRLGPGRRLFDLASRPVQLKMLVEVLPTYQGQIDELTVAILYEEFIDLVIRREIKKINRQTFGAEIRRKFAGELAYWMWTSDSGAEVQFNEIPDSLFQTYPGAKENLEGVKRDLLSGCFLERKPPGGYYFPHRSFMEYLVAQKLVQMAQKGDKAILNCPYLTPEVISFFIELLGKDGATRWKRTLKSLSDRISGNCEELVRTVFYHYGIDPPVHLKRDVPSATVVRREIRERQDQQSHMVVQDILSSAKGDSRGCVIMGKSKQKKRAR